MASDNCAVCQYLVRRVSWSSNVVLRTRGGNVYHAQKEIMKPNQEEKKTRPYTSTTLSTGIFRAFPLTGLTSGALMRSEKVKPRPMLTILGNLGLQK